MTSLSGQYSSGSGSGSGSFSLSGIMSHKDVADYFKFLKEDYQLGTTRLCKFISHVGYQFGNQWYIKGKGNYNFQIKTLFVSWLVSRIVQVTGNPRLRSLGVPCRCIIYY